MSLNATPSIDIKDNGSHWYDTWMMLRDSLIWNPWYSRNQHTLRRTKQDFSADRMHDWMMEVMKQRASYHHVIQAAIAQHADHSLAQVSGPALICKDNNNAWSMAYDNKLKAMLPDAQSIELSTELKIAANQLTSFLSA